MESRTPLCKKSEKKCTSIFMEGEWKTVLEKTTLSIPDRDSNPDLPVLSSLVYCESSVLDYTATEAGFFGASTVTHSGSDLPEIKDHFYPYYHGKPAQLSTIYFIVSKGKDIYSPKIPPDKYVAETFSMALVSRDRDTVLVLVFLGLELKLLSEKLKSLKECSCSEGENEVNRKKNRYKDILPSRVKLSEYVGVPGSNYINANFIRGASGSPAYIASQGPLPHTVNDFWRMVVEWDVQVIVMACSVEEAGKHKCEKYWVDHENEEKEFGNVKIRLVKASVICPDYLVRTMLIKKVCQYHYVAWPDHGVPSKVRPLVDMVRKVRETQVSETVPVLVHCSAGCGRTGTICAIDYVWGLLRSGKLSKDFSLFKLVQSMRKQRIAMVQTKEQYILVHQAVRELFNDQLRVIESHPYENIDINGMPLLR
uniref:protein-tyrosine-phosphatase n=1 Tax=Timema bartmani TaxID=61472 RepID=A0A7R9HYF6_9NEOP|nr:unnamed protein product [Timema bartmani]